MRYVNQILFVTLAINLYERIKFLRNPNEIPSNLNRGALPEPLKALENIRRKNINRLIFVKLKINSLRNKFESLQHIKTKILMYF